MAITTLSGAISGLRPPTFFSKTAPLSASLTGEVPMSYWSTGSGGNPANGGYDTTLNGVILSGSSSQVTGQIPYVDPPSGNAYVGRFQALMNNTGTLILADRLWHNGGYDATSTSAQNSTTPTWPARDVAGSTNGDGVLLGLELSTAMGVGTPNITVAYTNQAGTAGRTGANINATQGSSLNFATNFFPIGLQAGDTGVRSVQSLTLDATWTSGTMNLVAYREICRLPMERKNGRATMDAAVAMAQTFNGTVPFLLFIPSGGRGGSGGGNITGVQGAIQFTWG